MRLHKPWKTDRLRGATPDWPARTGWEGKHKLSLSSQAPDGRKASPLAGFPRKDLQILAGSARGKAPQAGREAAGKIRTGHVLGGRLCSNKGIEAWGQKHNQISPQRSSLSSGCSFSRLCPQDLFCHQSASKSLGSVVISTAVFLDNSQKTLFWVKKKTLPGAAQLPAGSGQRDFFTSYLIIRDPQWTATGV